MLQRAVLCPYTPIQQAEPDKSLTISSFKKLLHLKNSHRDIIKIPKKKTNSTKKLIFFTSNRRSKFTKKKNFEEY
jgi:hypothetical protein